jgi:hypothetical protein
MPRRRRVCGLAAIGFLWLGVTGCGGGVPSTGQSVNVSEDPASTKTKKSNLDELKSKMAMPKGQAKK